MKQKSRSIKIFVHTGSAWRCRGRVLTGDFALMGSPSSQGGVAELFPRTPSQGCSQTLGPKEANTEK